MLFCKPFPLAAVTAVGMLTATTIVTGMPANAQPALHHVHYTVGASQATMGEIYYRNVDPPNWGEYSHNPYLYSPNVEAELGPGKAWTFDVMLADPQQWSMVVVGLPGPTSQPLADPGFVCELRVDDVVVATDSGTKGALCSQRTW